jgi:hypothetical protein
MTGAAYVRKAVWVNPPGVGGHKSKASACSNLAQRKYTMLHV